MSSMTAEKTQNLVLVDDDTLMKALALDGFLDRDNAVTVESYHRAVAGGMPAWTLEHVTSTITELLSEVAADRAQALRQRPHSHCGRCDQHFPDEIFETHREICLLTGDIVYENLRQDQEESRLARKGAAMMRSIRQNRCVKCDRVLTNPQSVAVQIGPECATKVTPAELALLKAQVSA